MTVTVKKIGGSMAVVIPKAVARDMGLVEGSSLDLSPNPEGLLLRKRCRRPRRPLAEIVAAIDPAAYRRVAREFANDGPVGKEVW
jgi:antitoxin component of MazEF toxin-antitoxin module